MRSVFRKILLLLPLFAISIIARGQIIHSLSHFRNEFITFQFSLKKTDFPVANNDTVYFCPNCGSESFSVNIMANDSKTYTDSFAVYIEKCPTKGLWSIKSNGDFVFTNSNDFYGTLNFRYKIFKIGIPEVYDVAQIIVNVMVDTDCDGVMDAFDIDDDNDGIIDEDDGIFADTDKDSIPNYLDIDSDNDGIPDNIEGQWENEYILPYYSDLDGDGLDDAYDPDNGGSFFSPADTDGDGTPDFTDLNSDNDEYSDLNEAYDADFDTIPDINCSYSDCDKDGLDDNFDTVEGWISATNSLGHNAPLPDYNNDGIRDWRDAQSVKPIPGKENPLQAFGDNINIYPNPTNKYIKIYIPDDLPDDAKTLNIFTIKGELIFTSSTTQNSDIIDVSNLEEGVYVLQINFVKYNYTNRLVISKQH